MPRTLTPEQVERYERDGALCPIPVLTPEEVARFRAGFAELEAALGGRPRPIGLSHLFFRWAYELATHPAIADVVEDVLGPEILLHGSLIICKYPGDGSYVAWHQDGTYSGLSTTPTTSAWIALSESNADNGCMRVIPGSHRNPMLPHRDTYSPQNLLGHGEEIQVEVDEAQAVDLVLRPGEMSLHQNNIIHGSGPFRSGEQRIGFVLRLVTPELRTADLPITRIRGEADCSHLPLLAAPPTASVAAGLAPWREYMQQRRRAQEARRKEAS
jgi:ectoine hydroxylase-related dioxygenase (phytanoyl-CoA dioxygenase family)